MSRRSSVPSYRHHKKTNQAVVTLPLPHGGRRDVYLGAFNSPESKAEYARIISEWQANPYAVREGRSSDLTVNEVLVAFLRHADQYYRRPDGKPTSEIVDYRLAAKTMKSLYGATRAVEFGPLALKTVRQKFIESGLCRYSVNRRVARIRRMFKWATAEEMIPVATYQALTTVPGLLKGRTTAREAEPIRPVATEDVQAILPHVRPTVRAMIELQLLTGARPGEVCSICPADIDVSGPVWVYRPEQHKTAHHGKGRSIAIGPKGQAILRPFTPTDPAKFFFSPSREMEATLASRSAERKTPKYASHMKRNAAKRKQKPQRVPADSYATTSYNRAIARGCEAENERRERMAGAGNYDPVHWHANQLRHSYATSIRKRFGLEAVQVALGHSRADVTQIYAEKNEAIAVQLAAEVG